MTTARQTGMFHPLLAGALFLALCLTALFPASASAHSILLRSNPSRDSVLKSAPTQIQMWFSEDLNPTFTTAYVVNATHSSIHSVADKTTHVDLGNARIAANDPKELDLSLKPHLSPAIYLVFYRTQSAEDGHVLNGSFLFTIAEPDGRVPTSNGSLLSSDSGTSSPTDQLNSITIFSLLTVVLTDLGVVFWMGAQFWTIFVFELAESEDELQQDIRRRALRRFERFFSLPTLLLLLLSNIGVLLSQALAATSGDWSQALSFSLLHDSLVNGSFGTFWLLREGVIVLALLVATALFAHGRDRSRPLASACRWLNLLLGLALSGAVTLSGHAAAVRPDLLASSVLLDWLHLLAAALWVGGMLYLAAVYLPVLRGRTFNEQASALLIALPRYSPLAITGVLIMAVSGPSTAAVHIFTWQQLFASTYGQILMFKVLLVGILLLTSALHVFRLRPSLKKSHLAYQAALDATRPPTSGTTPLPASPTAQQVKVLERRVQRQTTWLLRVLRWEPLLGVIVLVCTGLLTIFSGTLSSTTASSSASSLAPAKPFVRTLKTTDGLFTLTLQVSPNRQGPNVFTVRALDQHGALQSRIGVSVYTTLLGMDMGTNAINLQPDGKGNFSASGDFSMSGNWQLRVEIRTPDNKLHEAKTTLLSS